MPLKIDDKFIIPAPLVTINKAINFANDGRPISKNFNITLEGTIIPGKGSPSSSGWYESTGFIYDGSDETMSTDDQRHNNLLIKQDLLREAFGTPGFRLQYSATGVNPVDTYPVVNSISFSPDNWVIRSNYSITLTAESINKQATTGVEDAFIASTAGLGLQSVEDKWQISQVPDSGSPFYEIVRTTSAKANAVYVSGNSVSGTEPWKNAKTWVDIQLGSGLTSSDTRFVIPSGSDSLYTTITEESIDKYAGNYSVNTRYIYAITGYVESRKITRTLPTNLINNGAPAQERISVQGTIRGLHASGDASGKLVNALAYWNSISGSLGTTVGASGQPTNIQYSEDVEQGSVDYVIDFVSYSTPIYSHEYSVTFSLSSTSLPNLNIAGNIQGFTNDSLPSGNTKFGYATTGWDAIEPTLKTLALAYSSVFGGADADYLDIPVNKSITEDIANGRINYNYTFGHIGNSSQTNTYADSYSVQFQTQNTPADGSAGLIVNGIINGTINGISPSGNRNEMIGAAATGWQAISGLLFTRVNNEFSKIGSNSPALHSGFVSRGLTINNAFGTITYSATFNNYSKPTGLLIAVQDVNVDQTLPNDVVATHIIPGRAAGPIVQDIATTTALNRTVNVALTFYPSGGNAWTWAGVAYPRFISSGIIEECITDLGTRASGDYYVTADSERWDFRNGFYTRRFSVIQKGS